ncbi:MAG TPA: hypothetical protein VHS31_05970, partial [Tepidisphaeraceae bacterium]|nr:hypothetical protein [Tepidisphaeraceae bacterium]
MFWNDGDIHDFEKASAIPDDSSDADRGFTVIGNHAEQAIFQADGSSFLGFATEARREPDTNVILNAGNFISYLISHENRSAGARSYDVPIQAPLIFVGSMI